MKATLIIAAATFACLSTTAFAADDANSNGSKKMPDSSAAATPSTEKHSAGTVGAMKNAGGGSFTASKKSMAKEKLK